MKSSWNFGCSFSLSGISFYMCLCNLHRTISLLGIEDLKRLFWDLFFISIDHLLVRMGTEGQMFEVLFYI